MKYVLTGFMETVLSETSCLCTHLLLNVRKSLQFRGAKVDEYKSKVGGREKKDIPFTFYNGFSGDTKT